MTSYNLRSKLFKIFLGALISFIVIVLVGFNALLVWVATGPRSLEKLTPYIEEAFRSPQNGFSAKIGDTVLLWDGWRHPIDIRLHNVTVLTGDGTVFSTFPEIALGIDIWSLPFGQILPTSLSINHPIVSLHQNEDRSISFGLKQENAEAAAPPQSTLPFAAVLEVLLGTDSSSNLRKLSMVSIRGADISLGNSVQGILMETTGTDLLFRRNRHGEVTAFASTQLRYDDFQSSLRAQLNMSRKSPVVNGKLEFTRLRLGALTKIIFENPELNNITMPLTGRSDFVVERSGNVQKLRFNIDAGKGGIKSSFLTGELPITTLHAEGELRDNFKEITLTTLSANMEGMMLTAAGEAKIFGENDAAIKGKIDLKNVPTEKIPLLWPPALSPQTRDWVVTSIKDGRLSAASANLDIKQGDLAKPHLPAEAVDATLTVSGASVRYLPGHPDVKNIEAVVHLDGVAMDTVFVSADYLKEGKLSDGALTIEDMNLDNPYIKLNFKAATSAREAAHILGLPRINRAGRLNVLEDKMTGRVNGEIALGFYFFESKEDIAYNIKAELKDVAQPGILKKFDLSNVDGTLDVNEKEVVFKGKGNVNGMTMSEATVKYLSRAEGGFDTFIDGVGIAPVASLPRFNIKIPCLIGGSVAVKGSIKQGAEKDVYDAAVDLTNASINYAPLPWVKAEKLPAAADIVAQQQGDLLTISSFTLKGADMDSKGSAQLDLNTGEFKQIALDKLVSGKSNISSLHYDTQPGGWKMAVKAISLNLAAWMKTDEGNFSFAKFPAVDFSADVDKLMLAEGKQLNNVKGKLLCDVKRCTSASITGNTGKPFSFRIFKNAKGKRQLAVVSEDGGAFLRALDIFDGMEGGTLTINGNYDDASPTNFMRGRLHITNHTIKDAPVLAKILSLASLTGFFDTLQGKGIAFKRTNIPFSIKGDVVTLEEGKTYGDSIGMTAEGTITMPKVELNIEGTVVPSYSLNTVLGKVPLVGGLLTGGEGQGVFAARYSVKGTDKDPSVSVNPLSMLTPGFLRGLFDIFDEAPPKPEEE